MVSSKLLATELSTKGLEFSDNGKLNYFIGELVSKWNFWAENLNIFEALSFPMSENSNSSKRLSFPTAENSANIYSLSSPTSENSVNF